MESIKQTKVTPENREQFYLNTYSQQTRDKSELIDLSLLQQHCKIIVDSCGWYYKQHFPEQKIIALENIQTASEYQLSLDKFDKLFDGRNDSVVHWPKIEVKNSVLIFDHAPLLKYKSVQELSDLLQSALMCYNPEQLILNHNLMFVDDARLGDRLKNIANLAVSNYIVTKFYFDLEHNQLEMRFKQAVNL